MRSHLGRCWLLFFMLPCLGALAPAFAQSHTISGFVSDADSGEKLIGANLWVTNANSGTVSNNYGFFSLTLPAGPLYLQASYLGFENRYFEIDLQADLSLNIELSTKSVRLDDIEVIAERTEDAVTSTQMGAIDVSLKEVQTLPAMFGEADFLKTLQLLPGVQGGSEGSNGLYVRGGGPDQNLILLDGAPVYNANHVFGFLSTFNSDALQNVSLIKGGFPARNGGRLSSVIDISMKEGNLKKFETDGSLGLIMSSLTVQGPIIEDKMSFIVSGRRTYADVLARPFLNLSDGEKPVFFFYDFNAKVNYIASPRSRLYASMYAGRDKFGYTFKEEENNRSEDLAGNLDWGNLSATLRWNYLFSNKLFANTSLIYSKYQFNTLARITEQFDDGETFFEEFNQLNYVSGIKDLTAKIDLDYLPTPDHFIRFGASAIRHAFKPGIGRYRFEETGEVPLDTELTPDTEVFRGMEYYLYAEDDINLGNRLGVNLGVHFSGMAVQGTNYTSLQPRLAMSFLLSPNWSFKASYSTMQQYLHLLTNSGINLPTDLWVAATSRVKPQQAWQAATGMHYAVPNGSYEFSVEGYYKSMKNLIEFKSGTSFLATNEDWQDKIEVGEGWSYGAEVFVRKKAGRTTGWLGYTLSWTERQFDGLNQGRVFPFRYDRRHDISIALSYQMYENTDVGLTWVYGTGNSITLPTARFKDVDYTEHIRTADLLGYGDRNGYRMGAYHRLDLALNWHKDRAWRSSKGSSTFTISIYNLYIRRNPYFIFGTGRGTSSGGTPLDEDFIITYRYRQISLFPLIPTFYYRFHF